MAFFGLRGRFSSIFGVFLRLYRCLLAPLSLQAPRGKRRFSWFFCENRPRGSRITMAGVEKYETSLTIKRTFKGIASYYGDWRANSQRRGVLGSKKTPLNALTNKGIHFRIFVRALVNLSMCAGVSLNAPGGSGGRPMHSRASRGV
jgi:hypothetical protein